MANWGILGFGRMGLNFAEAMSEVSDSKLISIASRSGKKYKNFENKSYDEIINNNNIDSVYISTLNNAHIELIDKLSESKKNILCEKPVSMYLNELIRVKKKIFENGYCKTHYKSYYPNSVVNNNKIGNKNNLIKKLEQVNTNFKIENLSIKGNKTTIKFTKKNFTVSI